jgi:hypothetical protein
MDVEQQPRRRAMDHTNQHARKAVADVLQRFTPWREAIAHMSGCVQLGRVNAIERGRMLDDCKKIEGEIAEARIDLLLQLADAPSKLTGHSRVVDAERALDNVEASLSQLGRLIAERH